MVSGALVERLCNLRVYYSSQAVVASPRAAAHNAGMASRPDYRNVHGRKWGRGARPWVLIPKVLFVAGLFGGLLTLVGVLLRPVSPATPEAWRMRSDLVQLTFTRVVIPCSTLAVLAGIVLLVMHGRVLLRMRWLIVKLAVTVLALPAGHLFLRFAMRRLQEAIATGSVEQAQQLMWQLRAGTAGVLLAVSVIAVLGRLKPRLGQDFGRTFSRSGPAVDAIRRDGGKS